MTRKEHEILKYLMTVNDMLKDIYRKAEYDKNIVNIQTYKKAYEIMNQVCYVVACKVGK